MSRRRRWILLPLAALAAALIVLAILFDWNWLKGLVEDQASAALGRNVELAGDLDVDLGLRPRITIEDAQLANAAWASDAPMAAVARAEAVIDLPALLRGRLELPEVIVTAPAVSLETRPDGPPNWQLGPDEPSEGPPTIPRIGRLQVRDASIRYHEYGSGRTIAARLTEASGSTDDRTELTATGEVEGEPLDLTLRGGSLAQLENAAQPFPLSLDLKLGESDLAGDLRLDLGGDVPAVNATLRSKLVKSAGLARLIAAADTTPTDAEHAKDGVQEPTQDAAQAGEAPTDPGTLLDFGELPAANIDLAYTIGRLEGPDLTMQDVSLDAGLHDRLPSLSLQGGGTFRGEPVMLDVQAGPAEGGEQPQVPYDMDARIEAGQTRITASGGIDEPQRLQGLHLEFDANSPDATELLRQLGIEVPELPAIQASGRLTREGEVWRLSDMQAKVGESDLAGQISADLSRTRPFISADLRSSQLLAKDLMPTPEAEEAAEEVAEEAAKEVAEEAPGLITVSGVNFEALPEIDVDLEFRGDRVEAPEFVFDQLELALKLRDGIVVVDATGDGTFREFGAVSFEAHAGTEESLKNPDARYPLDLALWAEETRASAKGTVDRPLDYTGLDVDVALEGPDLQMLGNVLQLPLPATPPYQLAGKVTHQPDQARWNLIALRGTVGDSDLSGDVSLELDAARPTIVADLKSKKLDFDDLGVLVGAPPETGPGETASPQQERQAAQETEDPRILPDAKFRVPDLRAFDARISFTGESIQASKLPLERLALELTLEDGVIGARPVRVGLAGGGFEAAARLDGREDLLAGKLELAVRQIRVNELLSRFDIDIAEIELEKEGVGTLGGRTALEVRGNSIREMAASADGRLAIIMDGGRINALIVEAIGLDVGEAVALLLSGDEEEQAEMVPVQCLVARFDIQDGIMRSDALVLETNDATITGKGQVDLGKETLSLELLAHPKDASVLTASTPVRIEGIFKKPEIGLVSEELQEKSLAALALGVVLPVIGAVLPFVEQGETKGPNCQRLIRDAQAAMPDAPAPDPAE
jgi:AsmA family protein